MRLYLVRHAQSLGNVRKSMSTVLPGESLSELGRQQAIALAENLADEPVVAVYASYATRAQQTAAPLAEAKKLDLQLLEGVHEVQVGDLEGRTDPEGPQIFAQVVRPWTRGDLSSAMPNGENGQEVYDRYLEALALLRAKHEYADPDGVVVLVSHGGAIRFAADWVSDNVRPEIAEKELIPNAGIVALETRSDGGWHCLSWAGTPM